MHSWNTCFKVHMFPKMYSWSIFTAPVERISWLSVGVFLQDCYCHSNSNATCHVTKYCNVVGPYCTVQWNMACIRSSPNLFTAEVGLAREMTDLHVLSVVCVAKMEEEDLVHFITWMMSLVDRAFPQNLHIASNQKLDSEANCLFCVCKFRGR